MLRKREEVNSNRSLIKMENMAVKDE